MLRAFDDSGALPAADLAERDRELNTLYRRLLKLMSPDAYDDAADPSLPRNQLREAERRWLDYANACEAFRTATQAPVRANALRRLLVVQRIAALHNLLEARGETP